MNAINAQYIEAGQVVLSEDNIFSPGEDVVVLAKADFENLKKAVEETKREIDLRFKHRGDRYNSKKIWEEKLLWFANTALGLPAGKFPKPTR